MEKTVGLGFFPSRKLSKVSSDNFRFVIRQTWLLPAKQAAAHICIRNCESISWRFRPVAQQHQLKAWQEGKEIVSFGYSLPLCFCSVWVKLASPFRWNSPRKFNLKFSKSNSYRMKKSYFQKQHFKMKLCSLSKRKLLLSQWNSKYIQFKVYYIYLFSYWWLQSDWSNCYVLVTILSTETWSWMSLVLPTPVHFRGLQYLHMKSVSQE